MNRYNSRKSKQIKAKNNQKKPPKNPKRPKRPLLVEPNFASFLTDKEYKKDQLYTNKKRTVKFIHDEFETFKYLLQSEKLDQEYKNLMFPSTIIDSLFQSFQYYDIGNTEYEEQNKLNIANDGIKRGLSYLQIRYGETTLIYQQIEDFKKLMSTLRYVSETKAEDQRAVEFYKMRHRMLLPPTIRQHERHYTVMCRICWGYYSGEKKDKTISQIHHRKKCPYDKNDLERCIEVFPPKVISKT